jgi:uncharacterized protein (TIGR04206 family)
MTWVNSEYAGELAVLSAWLAALLPWSVTVRSGTLLGENASLVVVRFPVAMFQFLFGPEVQGFDSLVPVWAAPGFTGSEAVATAYTLWLTGGALVGLAVALSAIYYARDERLEARSPVDPVRLMGALLLPAGVLLFAAAVLLFRAQGGVTVPIGAALVPVLGGLLLVVERTEPASPRGDAEPE